MKGERSSKPFRFIKRGGEILREDGVGKFVGKARRFLARRIRQTYDQSVRPTLPHPTVEYNGVEVRHLDVHLFDSTLSWYTASRPNYEYALIRGIREVTEPGDDVIIVGGGVGPSTVAAAEQVGEAGSVLTFEGTTALIDRIRETSERNDVADRVTVQHAIVGPEINLDGNPGDADQMSPAKLPPCNVLVLDCEGAELSILNELQISPSYIVVESHGCYGSSSDAVASALGSLDYDVISCDVAEVGSHRGIVGGRVVCDDLQASCEEKDVFVFVAKKGVRMDGFNR